MPVRKGVETMFSRASEAERMNVYTCQGKDISTICDGGSWYHAWVAQRSSAGMPLGLDVGLDRLGFACRCLS
jgi:hypothetical protein